MRRIGSMIATVMFVPMVAWADGTASLNDSFQAHPEVAPAASNPVQSKFKLSVGGFVRLDYAYNSENFGPGGFLSPGNGAIPSKAIASQAAAANQEQSILSSRATQLWVKSSGPDFLGAKTAAIIQGDFNGDASSAAESPMVRLRLAYATLKWDNIEVLFGQDWDTFGPMVAASLDFRNGTAYGTPNNQRVPQIKIKAKAKLNPDNEIIYVFAVQDPNQLGNNQSSATGGYGSSVNVASQLSLVSKSIGTAPGSYGFSLKPLTVTLFGLYGTEHVPSNANRIIDSYSYGLYAFVPVLSSKDDKGRSGTVSFEGQTYAATNMSFNNATYLAVVGTPTTGVGSTFDASGNQSAAKGFGYAAQLIAYPTQDLGLTVGYGGRYARDFDSYAGIANYQRSSSSLYVNLAYDLNSAVRVATEYQNLKTVYGNANSIAGAKAVGSDNTVRFVGYYFF